MTAAFDVISDGGLDPLPSLRNDVPRAEFTLTVNDKDVDVTHLSPFELYRLLRDAPPYPQTAQPKVESYLNLFRQATRPLLVVTVPEVFSGSLNAAHLASLQVEVPVTVHDCGTVSVAQAFQVHAAMTARACGLDPGTALKWMQDVHQQTELLFTVDSLRYLRHGGRITHIEHLLGGRLHLRPVLCLNKTTTQVALAGRAHSWEQAVHALANRVTSQYGKGSPLSVGVVHGENPGDAWMLLELLDEHHDLRWSGTAPVGPALAVHTGPRVLGVAVSPVKWPWEAHEEVAPWEAIV